MARPLPIVERLQEELAGLRRELSIDLPRQIEEARAHGDLKENAEYHAAKERQGLLTARVSKIDERLRELSLYTLSSIPREVVGYGSEIELEDCDSGESVTYKLVFPEEVDEAPGRVSISSPVGQAMLNRGVGDEVRVSLPEGGKTFQIVGITTLHELLEE